MEFLDIIRVSSDKYLIRFWNYQGGKKEMIEISCSRFEYEKYIKKIDNDTR